MTLHSGTGMAFAIGVMVAAIICVIVFKFANSNRKIKSEYDERQEAIRNRGYKYAFYTVAALEAVMMILALSEATFVVATYLIHFGILLVGLLVLCVYCIWHDAYWGLNNNRKRYTAIIVVAIVLNLLPVVRAIAGGDIRANGFNSLPVLNLMVIIWMAVIGICAVAKKIFVKTEDEEA